MPWSCEACTLINEIDSASACSVCGTPRVVPASASQESKDEPNGPPNCRGKHGLKAFTETKGFGCDVGSKICSNSSATMYGCRTCNFDCCASCFAGVKMLDPNVHPATVGKHIKPKDYDAACFHPAAVYRRRKSWMPLVSDPNLMNSYLTKLGAQGCSFVELFGFDDELLGWIPRPVKAVLLLFPINETSEKYRADEEAKIVANGQTESKNCYFIKQIIGNACGTIGLIHAVMNNMDSFRLEKGKFWANFHADTKSLSALERAKALEDNEDIEQEHQSVARSGGTEGSSSASHEIHANLHFIVFTEVDGDLYEFDGRKNRPINHGPAGDVLVSSAAAIRGFLTRAEGDFRFNAVALVPNSAMQ